MTDIPQTNALVARDPSPRLRYNGYDPLNKYTWKHAQNYRPNGRRRGPIFRQYDKFGNPTNQYYDPYNTQGGGVQRTYDSYGNPVILNGGAECVTFNADGSCKEGIAK